MGAPPNLSRRILLAAAACVFLVGFSILFVDRPASTWSHEHLSRPAFMNQVTHLPDPLPIAASLCLVGVAIAAVFRGHKPGENTRTLVAASLAVLVSSAVKEQLKFVFGRPWPETWNANNPSWIGDRTFGFHFAHGGTPWESFPSGHMAEVAAIAAVLWMRLPRFRWLSVALVAVVAVSLWILNYHFIGDIIAGAFLGLSCGFGMVAVACRQ